MSFSSNEELLISAVTAGRLANFRDRSLDVPASNSVKFTLDSPPKEEVEASLIRRILMGMDIDLPGEQQPGIVRITDAGVRLFGATVTGTLDLEDLFAPGGTPSRLEFENCWFNGPISIKRSRLRNLTLRKCAFRELQASDSVIEGPVDLSYARSSQSPSPGEENGAQPAIPRLCWVVLAGSQIKGRVNAAHAHFAAPEKRHASQWVPFSRHPRYALDLRGTRIEGSVHLRPDVSAYGGVCLILSRVEGSLWCNGAKLIAVEDCAFSADYANIHGSIYMRPYEAPVCDEDAEIDPDAPQPFPAPTVEFRIEGCFSLYSTKLGGSLYLGGATLMPRVDGEDKGLPSDEVLLNAANAVIGGDCYLNCATSKLPGSERQYHFKSLGKIVFSSARIGRHLSFDGAMVQEIHAENAEIGGDCSLSAPFDEAGPSAQLFHAAIAIHLNGSSIKGDLDLSGARIGKPLCLSPGVSFSGLPELISHDDMATVCSNDSEPLYKRHLPSISTGIFAPGITIGGNCYFRAFKDKHGGKTSGLRFECVGRIFMISSKIGGSLIMEGARVVGPVERAAIDLSSSTFGGDVLFRTWDQDSADSLPFQLRGGQTGVRLVGTRIAQKLNLNGSELYTEGVAVNAQNLEVGGKASFGVFLGKRGGTRYLYRFAAFGQVSLTSATIRLGLDMSGASLQTSGEVTRPGALGPGTALDLKLAHCKFVRLTTHAWDGGGETVFAATGGVVLTNAEIDAELDCKHSYFFGPLCLDYARIGTSVDLTNALLWSGSTANIGSDAPARNIPRMHIERSLKPDLSLHFAVIAGSLVVDCLGRCNQDGPGHITIDLRGLRVGELQDRGGNGWTTDGRVRFWMDGFRYARLPEVTPSRRTPTVSTIFHRLLDQSWLPPATDQTSSWRHASASTNLAPIDSEPSEEIAPSWAQGLFQSDGIWEDRLRWLNLQYYLPGRPTKIIEFSPDAYGQLIRVLNANGSYDDARRIASAKLTHEVKLIRHGPLKFLWILFGIFFDYGFSGLRAISTFVLCIILGTLGVIYAEHVNSPVLVLNTNLPETVLMMETEGAKVYPLKAEKNATAPEEIPCGGRIRPLLYALDVFVPVLDLRQQEVCSIGHKHIWWRYGQATYAVAGWVLTPLMLLTLTGVLRKHLEE
jgi:hypothetical protein